MFLLSRITLNALFQLWKEYSRILLPAVLSYNKNILVLMQLTLKQIGNSEV